MRIVHIFMLLQEVLWVDFIFRHINSSKSYSGGFLSTWRPNRKSFENQAHFVSLSETSVHYFLCDISITILNISGDRALIPRQSKMCPRKHGGFLPKIRHFYVTLLWSRPLTSCKCGKSESKQNIFTPRAFFLKTQASKIYFLY